MNLYSKYPYPDGAYIAQDGQRYDVVVVRRVRDPRGVNVGCESYPSLAAALDAWGLCIYK